MAIKFIPKFKIAGVIADVQKRVKNLEDVLIDRLMQVGENFVTNARNNGTYTNRTGNLRSSIGYVIYKNGSPLFESFPGDKETGLAAGEKAAGEAAIPKKGFCLVVVAGMNYAIYVEAKNYDVITGSSYKAKSELKRSIEFIRKNI